ITVHYTTAAGSPGNTKFRVDSDGDIFTDGSTTVGTPADLAENYPVLDSSIEAGDLVSLDNQLVESNKIDGDQIIETERITAVKKSSNQYDSNLVGVISTKPGILLSGFSEKSKPVALSGRVPVKVNTQNGSINIGDPLTSSDTPGVAMKATKTGKIIGYALESYNTEQEIGKIKIFLNLSWHIPQDKQAVVSNDNQGLVASIYNSLKELVIDMIRINQSSDLASNTIGEGQILTGQQETFINASKIAEGSKVFVSVVGSPIALGVCAKNYGVGFKVCAKEAVVSDVQFSWWIVGVSGYVAPQYGLQPSQTEPVITAPDLEINSVNESNATTTEAVETTVTTTETTILPSQTEPAIIAPDLETNSAETTILTTPLENLEISPIDNASSTENNL
ncbi:MAG: hypothetical protein AAB890_00505, partial [Patescibacteria group bacterium]